jgi:hypothetical protein
MKTYVLQPSPEEQHPAVRKWQESDFYNKAVVLGIDIGLQGIGVYLRKGPQEIFAKTLLFEVPETGRLESRRQKRAWRHTRNNRATRRSRLKTLMANHDIPWVTDEVLSKTDPFLLRHRAITGKLASSEALSICIRHLVDHRGFDYSAFAEDGAFPWGDGESAKEVIAWIDTNFINEVMAKEILTMVSPLELKEADVEKFQNALEGRKAWCSSNGIDQVLHNYSLEKKPNLRAAARGHNFPRTMVEQHLRSIISRHQDLLQNAEGFTQSLFLKPKTRAEKDAAIFHYNRKTRSEAELVWKRRINKCQFAPSLGFGSIRVSPNSDPAVGAWKAIEFLATRRVEVSPKEGRAWLHIPAPETISKLVEIARSNRIAFKEKKPLTPWKEAKGILTADIIAQCGKGAKPTPDKDSPWNESYFTQLQDIIKPTVANLRGNSSISTEVATRLFEIATLSGECFEPDSVKGRLNEAEFYNQRRSAVSTHMALYPQVEFLLGRRVHKKGKFRQASTGRLQRLFSDLSEELDEIEAPDYCVVEVIRDAPRNQSQKAEYLKLQIERRKDREARFAERGTQDTGNTSSRRRVALHHQQGGLSPYTGKPLPDPMDPSLEIEHLFPESRGGLSCDENLVLTFRGENGQKGNMTPREAAAANLPGWLSWSEMLKITALMRWSRKKREIFAFETTPETSIPDLGNITRTSQLARQLVREVAAWMGVDGDATGERERVGTPSGWLAAQARKSWLGVDGYTKIRSSLVHHLVDAAILAHIPPAAGLNLARYGGIFFTTKDGKTRALPELGPKLDPWLVDSPVLCPVEKSRSNSRTRSLGDETFWAILPPDEQGRQKTRQRTPLKHDAFSDGVEIHAMLVRMGVPSEKIPGMNALQKWLDKAAGGSETPLTLNDGTPVRNIHKFDSKGEFTMPLGWSARPTKTGSLHGARLLDGKFDRMEIWVGWNARKNAWAYYTRLIPSKRALRHLEQTLPGWWKKNRIEVCGELPPYARKVGSLQRGDKILIPMNRAGEIDYAAPYVRWWYEVTALIASGRVKLASITYRAVEGTPLSHLNDGILTIAPMSASVIAALAGKRDANAEATILGITPPSA